MIEQNNRISFILCLTESGNPKDNAVAKHVHNTVKNEMLMGMHFTCIEEVMAAVDAAVV